LGGEGPWVVSWGIGLLGKASIYLFRLTDFPMSNFHAVLGYLTNLDFPIHKKSPNCPKFVKSPIFYLVSYYGGNWKIQKSPNCPKLSQSPKTLPISNPIAKSPISKVQKISNNLKGTMSQDWLKFEHQFVITEAVGKILSDLFKSKRISIFV
jgi:hypothetical protein